VRWLILGAARRVALDQPNERSLHSTPVPRLGGAGILAGTLVGWLFVRSGVTESVWFGTILLASVSLLDDLRDLPIALRFLAHFVAAAVFAIATLGDASPWWLVGLVVVGIAWVTNLYNFMDGSDGLAGGMAIFGFGAYGIGAYIAGAQEFAVASLCIAASAAAFLRYNFSPAKTFMGDIGSIPLGFLGASLGILGVRRGLWPVWFPFIVFSPFLVDATVTILARLLRGEKIWHAHRTHYYQRLVLMGWGHRKVALAEYGLMFAVAASSLACLRASITIQLLLIAAWVVVYVAVLRLIDVGWHRYEADAARVSSSSQA
jgi:UDP-N-acetylmuramyl pentapeptide phosphotransferase/UDP-N-acetylglucosamine-1-phosphate transferase